MKDPTLYVFLAAMLTAGLVFGTAWFSRASRAIIVRGPTDAEDPYAAPASIPPPPLLPAGKVITWPYRGWDLAGIALVALLFFGMALLSAAQPVKDTSKLNATILVVNIFMQFAFAGSVILAMGFRVKISQWLGLRWREWPWVLLIAPVTVAVLWTFFILLQLTGYAKWMESLGVETTQDTVKLLKDAKDPLLLGLMSFAAVFVAPVCEEILFRGYLYGASKKFAGGAAAAVFSALVFAAAHGSLAALLPLFVVGLALVFVYEKTGSLWAPMAVHFCFNGATVGLQFLARAYGWEVQ